MDKDQEKFKKEWEELNERTEKLKIDIKESFEYLGTEIKAENQDKDNVENRIEEAEK